MRVEVETNEHSRDGVFSIKVLGRETVLIPGNASGLQDIAKAILSIAQSGADGIGKPHMHIDPGDVSSSESFELIIMLDNSIVDR